MRHPFFDGVARRAVAVAVHMGPFQEGIARHHAVKLFGREKKVFPAMLFLSAWRAGGV